jgi:hypothetical protein
MLPKPHAALAECCPWGGARLGTLLYVTMLCCALMQGPACCPGRLGLKLRTELGCEACCCTAKYSGHLGDKCTWYCLFRPHCTSDSTSLYFRLYL